jgi:hypothetical protein
LKQAKRKNFQVFTGYIQRAAQFFHAVGLPLVRRYTCMLQRSPVFGRGFGMRHNTCRVFGEDNAAA